MASLGFDIQIKAGVPSCPVLPIAGKTMQTLNAIQRKQKTAPPFSADVLILNEKHNPSISSKAAGSSISTALTNS